MEPFLQRKLTAFNHQKQPQEVFYKECSSNKFRKIHIATKEL